MYSQVQRAFLDYALQIFPPLRFFVDYMLKNIFIAMKWNLIIHKDLFLIISEVWINKTLLNRYQEKFICMEDADLLFIFKMFAIDFLFIKNEKKIYVLQKGNIKIIDFFSRYRIINLIRDRTISFSNRVGKFITHKIHS